jgi:hypothetical protein
MTIKNPSKATILLAALAALTVLMALGRIDTAAGMPILTAIVFYAIGNGIAARSGTSSEPIIAPKESEL